MIQRYQTYALFDYLFTACRRVLTEFNILRRQMMLEVLPLCMANEG